MNTTPAVNILDNCEKALRTVAGDALAAGNYGNARQVIAWAEIVADMARIARVQAEPKPTPATPAPPPLPARPAKGRPAEDQYPRFLRRGDELVKVGWSKQERKEYHHRAPRAALDAVVSTLKRIASDGSTFTSENLSLLKDEPRGTVFPLYQVFVVLAWLRHLGLVKQHGRKGGYSLTTDLPISTILDSAWPDLPPG